MRETRRRRRRGKNAGKDPAGARQREKGREKWREKRGKSSGGKTYGKTEENLDPWQFCECMKKIGKNDEDGAKWCFGGGKTEGKEREKV
jgi:hypothetical protein